MLLGISFLAAIGFTMSLFINSLAFSDQNLIEQAKMGVLMASLVSGLVGYLILKRAIGR
jgi:NhaA family Na+:H+ antiporter